MRRAAIFVSILGIMLVPLHTFAHHGKEYLVTATYKTPERGSLFALWSSEYVDGGHHDGDELEIEPGLLYGLTDRWSIELHTHHAFTSDDLATESVALETRLRLFGPGEIHDDASSPGKSAPFSLGALFEFEKGHGDEHDALGGRVIIGKEMHSFSVVVNLIGEKVVGEDTDVEYLYAIGLRKSLSSAIGVGLEFDGGFQEKDGFSLTPGLYGTITRGFDFRIGPSIGFGDRSDERRLRATFLYQF